MKNTRTSSISFGSLALALITFVGGFALAWILRGQNIIAPQVLDTPAQEQTTQQEVYQQEEPDQLDELEIEEDTAGHHTGSSISPTVEDEEAQDSSRLIDENGSYSSKDDVALYIHTYAHLPPNYISKTAARKAGWVANEGNLWEVLPGMSIGGSEFYNDEGLLPDAPGRTWTECDINYQGGYRGAERIVFSDDGLIFYTDDHYESFTEISFD